MIWVFINHSRDEIRRLIKTKSHNYTNIEEADSSKIRELAESQNIFGEPQDFFIVEYPKNKDEAKILGEDFLNKSKNNFYFEYLTAPSYIPKKTKAKLFEKKQKPLIQKEPLNSFLLSDTLFSKGAQETWLAFNKLKNNVSLEELHGTFLWAIKTVLLNKDKEAQKTISSFIKSKISGSLSKQDNVFIKDFYKKALTLGVEAHLGKVDFENSFERLILTLPR